MPETSQNIISTFDCVIVGAGAAGLMAAIETAKRGRRVLLLEKNSKPGVKILMSGGTRCNLRKNSFRDSIKKNLSIPAKYVFFALIPIKFLHKLVSSFLARFLLQI